MIKQKMDDLFFIKNFSLISEAELAKQVLEANGIKSVIQKGDLGAASKFTAVGDVDLYVFKKNVEKARKILKINKKGEINPEDFVNIGSFRAEEADIITHEFEKDGIPVKRFYPGTSIGVELSGFAIWTAYTLRIRRKDIKTAMKICEKFNIKPVRKIPLPNLLYNKTSSVLLGITFFGLISYFIISVFDLKIIDPLILIVISLISFLVYYIVLFYRIVKKYLKLKNKNNRQMYHHDGIN